MCTRVCVCVWGGGGGGGGRGNLTGKNSYYIKHMAYNAYMEIAARLVLSCYDNHWYLANCELGVKINIGALRNI